jgi:hypothetical protein
LHGREAERSSRRCSTPRFPGAQPEAPARRDPGQAWLSGVARVAGWRARQCGPRLPFLLWVKSHPPVLPNPGLRRKQDVSTTLMKFDRANPHQCRRFCNLETRTRRGDQCRKSRARSGASCARSFQTLRSKRHSACSRWASCGSPRGSVAAPMPALPTSPATRRQSPALIGAKTTGEPRNRQRVPKPSPTLRSAVGRSGGPSVANLRWERQAVEDHHSAEHDNGGSQSA